MKTFEKVLMQLLYIIHDPHLNLLNIKQTIVDIHMMNTLELRLFYD